MLLIMPYSIYAQVDNISYEHLLNDKISNSGNIVSYYLMKQGNKKLVVKDLKRQKTYYFEGLTGETVLLDDYFVGYSKTKKLSVLVNFNRAQIDSTSNVDDFHWINETENILLFNKGKKELFLRNFKTAQELRIDDVDTFIISEDKKDVLVYTALGRYFHIQMEHFVKKEIFFEKTLKSLPKRIVRNNLDGDLYMLYNDTEVLKLMKLKANKVFDIQEISIYNEVKSYIIDTLFSEFKFLPNHKLAITVKPANIKKNINNVEVWKGSCNGISPQLETKMRNNKQLLILNFANNEIKSYFDENRLQKFKIGKNGDFIYRYDENLNEDLTREFPFINIEIGNVYNDHFKDIGVFSGTQNSILEFSDFPYLFYFKNNNWHSFSTKTFKHENFTENLGDKFYELTYNYLNLKKDDPLSTIFKWKNDKLLLRGYHDIWLFDVRNNKIKKMTGSVNKHFRYSLASNNYDSKINDWAWTGYEIKYNDILLHFSTEDFKEEGIAVLQKNDKVLHLLNEQNHFSQFKRSTKFVSYVKENKNLPPELYVMNMKTGEETIVYSTNVEDKEAKSIRSEYVSWINDMGEKRGGVIIYPLNYDPDKKYPAIVNVYETRFKKQHIYESPSENLNSLLKTRSYIGDGYFIIEPDVHYDIGNPGVSSAACIVQTMERLIEDYPIDKNRIGIYGHSFGGYETNFVITQSNLFKTAVSSAGVSDLENFYLTMNWSTLKPDMWRMENQQFRMGVSLFDNPERYKINSPIRQIKNIHTPLLLISGKEDYQVNWQQSVYMFLGMKRLNKQVSLLLYPKEGHQILKKENVIDMDSKIKDWFDHFLKDSKKPEWL